MAVLDKEVLEYQRNIFELPRYLISAITIFTTAASFLVRTVPESSYFGLFIRLVYLLGIVLTCAALALGYSVVTSVIRSMRDCNDRDAAEKSINEVISGVYQKFSFLGMGSVLYWIVAIVLMVFAS